MKRLITIFLLLFSISAFADDIHSYHFYAAPIQLQPAPWDDTAGLQALLNAGNVTLTRNYSISATETVTYLLHLNGFTINTSQTTGAVLKLGSSGAAVDNGTVAGTWNYLTLGSTTGVTGIVMNANNTTVSNVTVTQVSGYGINAAHSNITVNNCTITKTGYIGFYFDPEANGTTNNKFTNNTVDRSMISPSAILGLAVGIRGSTNAGYTTSGWQITGNFIKMPLNPTSNVDECLEIRYLNNSNISHNTFFQGSISASVINCSTDTIAKNKASGAKWESYEYGQSSSIKDSCNKATGGIGEGYLIDGYGVGTLPTTHIALLYDTVATTTNSAVHAFFFTDYLTIKGCVLSTTLASKVVNLQQSNHITLLNNSIDGGSHSGVAGVYFESCHGNLTNTNGSVTHCTYAIYAYSTTTGAVTDSITFNHVTLTAGTTQKSSTFSNGAHYGPNIFFNAVSMTFAALPAKTYGDIDFGPGAVSTLPITYTSSNTAIASIVSGNIHITGTGSVNITATNADTAIVRSLTVSKAALAIFADPQVKQQGAINPTLTATYAGFVYGQTNSVLTTQPTLATAAVTGSPIGVYAITNSGAAAANYTITNYGSFLIIYGGPVIHRLVIVQ